VARSANPGVAPSPLDKGKGAASVASAQVAPGGRRKRDDAGCGALTGRSFRSPLRSARELQVGPRRPAPKPTSRRGASVLRSRRHHHHLGVITPRDTSSSNNNSSRSRSGDHLVSRVTRRSRASSKCSPFFFEPNHHADKS
jgi:hypothetical protein